MVFAVFVIILGQVMMIAVYASRYKRVPPNQALVVYGRKYRPGTAREGFIRLLALPARVQARLREEKKPR